MYVCTTKDGVQTFRLILSSPSRRKGDDGIVTGQPGLTAAAEKFTADIYEFSGLLANVSRGGPVLRYYVFVRKLRYVSEAPVSG